MKTFLITASLVLTNILFAQKISIGPELGVNLIPIESTDLENNYQLGTHFGAQFNYNFSTNFSLKSGLFLTQKKKTYTFTDTTETVDFIATTFANNGENIMADVYNTTHGSLNELYLELPILANYEFKKINIYLGPYVNFVMSATRKEKYSSESTAIDPSSLLGGSGGGGGFASLLSGLFNPSEAENATIKSKEGLSIFDVGATAGIGYRVDKLRFDLSYSYGFLDYRKEKEDDKLENHQIFRLSIAYLFNISGSKGLNDRYNLDVK